MLFPTIQFGIFFPIVFVGSWLLRPHPRRWKLFMLVASYVFYGWWDWHYCLLLAAVTVANQIFVVGINEARSHAGQAGVVPRWRWPPTSASSATSSTTTSSSTR